MENPLLGMLNQWTIAAIFAGPLLFQHVKSWYIKLMPDGREMSKTVATLGNAGCIAGAVVWQGVLAGATPLTIAGQAALGLIVSELVYKNAVEPMANSSNPLVPQTATKAEAKAERAV